MPELTTDTLTIADRRGNSIDIKVKVLGIIGGLILDAEVVNLIIDSIIQGGRQGGSRNGAFRGQNGQNRILGIDFMRESKLTLDFDKKSLVIPDDQIKQLPIVENQVEIDLSDTKLETPVLHLPNFQEQFNLFTDASGVGIGAVLNQNHRPIAFASRTLNKAERNFTVTERECLAAIWALNKFWTYFGTLLVKVITDYATLTKLTNRKNLSSLMIRWALKLSKFNIEWEHRPGVQNVVTGVLSRNPVDNADG
ncbi:retrovirus-related Pol polyprotein from transposon opus [Trichonephila clavipes]|nr:retrovirus-related Pol polyprotein from transposon opus [Trichonephila clavipes]